MEMIMAGKKITKDESGSKPGPSIPISGLDEEGSTYTARDPAALKRRKLQLKDEITRLAGSGQADAELDVAGANRRLADNARVRAPSHEGKNDKRSVHAVQLKRIGNSLGVIFPKELLARLKLKEGDVLHIIEQTERGIKLSPYDPKHAKAMEIARRAFRTYADTFKALAK